MWKDLTTYCLRHLRSDLIKVSEIWSPTLVLSLQDSSVGGTPEVMGYRNAPCGVPGEPIQKEKKKCNKKEFFAGMCNSCLLCWNVLFCLLK